MQYRACKLHRALTVSQLPMLVKSLKYTVSASATQSSSTALSAEVSLTRKFWTGVPRCSYKQQLHQKLVAWQRKLSLLDSSVSLAVKGKRRKPDDFKVSLLWYLMSLCPVLFVSISLSFFFLIIAIAFRTKLHHKSCSCCLQWYWSGLGVSVTTSRDSMSKMGDKHQKDTLVPWKA